MDNLVVKLKRKLNVKNVEFDFIELIPPRRKDMKEAEAKGKNNPQELIERLVKAISVSPELSYDDVLNIAQSDFVNISKMLMESGFLGDSIDLKDNEFEPAPPELVEDNEYITVDLSEPITFMGEEVVSVTCYYPTVRDFKSMNKINDDASKIEVYLKAKAKINVKDREGTLRSNDKYMNPDIIDNLTQIDFAEISRSLTKSGFFGVLVS